MVDWESRRADISYSSILNLGEWLVKTLIRSQKCVDPHRSVEPGSLGFLPLSRVHWRWRCLNGEAAKVGTPDPAGAPAANDPGTVVGTPQERPAAPCQEGSVFFKDCPSPLVITLQAYSSGQGLSISPALLHKGTVTRWRRGCCNSGLFQSACQG